MNKDKQTFFQQRINEFVQKVQLLQKQDNTFSFVRITFFIIALILIVWFANEREAALTATVLMIATPIFIFLVKKHQKIIAQKKHFIFLKEINEKEIKRLDGKFSEFGNNGSQYFDETHSCTADLDIFGQNSLFQFLAHTVTPLGDKKLADWLRTGADKLEIRQRQEAAKELATKIDFLQDFEASGLAFKQNDADSQKFGEWMHQQNQFSIHSYQLLLAYGLPTFLLLMLGIIAFFDLPLLLLLIPIVPNVIVLSKISDPIKKTLQEILPLLPTIQAASKLIELIEKESFISEKMRTLKSQVSDKADTNLISKEIKKLSNLLSNLEFRQNPYFFIFVNIPLLWDLHFLIGLEKWRKKHKAQSEKWFDTVAEFEALNSLACLHFLFPHYAFPQISEEKFVYQAQNLGHPLIHHSKRVANDFSIEDKGTIYVVTGSNMSGKSTFLRTIGINAALALIGAPVCANQMQISVLQIFTSMRTHDSLSESVSSFYAELKRIRQLLDKLHDEPPILFLLDEILKGTNSEDRNKGAKGLIRQLHKYKLSGLVSTHDLELGKLAAENPHFIKNYSFNSELIGDNQLHFPYKLSEGVCKSFNASVLMKIIGIEME
jgi:DNA mismatch repair ATPase MutS